MNSQDAIAAIVTAPFPGTCFVLKTRDDCYI